MIYSNKKVKFVYYEVIFLLLFAVDYVFSDVIQLQFPLPPGENVITSDNFVQFIKLNPKNLPNEQNQLFLHDQRWEMPGYAAFFPQNKNPRAYAAKKRITIQPDVPDNNPGTDQNYANLFNYNPCMHTERQLAIAALANYLPASANEKIINIPDSTNNITNIKNLNGELHIYTRANPCQNAAPDNRNFSCISYYNALAECVPNVRFHIYFLRSEMALNPEFFNDQNALNALCDFISSNRIQINGLIVNNDYFEYSEKKQRKKLFQLKKENWSAVISGCETFLVRLVNKSKNKLTDAQLDQMFNQVHNTAHRTNLTYHPI